MKSGVVLLALVLLAGCAVFPGYRSFGPDADMQQAAAAVKEKKYDEAVTLYKKIIAEAPQSDAAGDALFQIAVLRTFHDNPHRDYAQALQGFEEFIKKYPLHANVFEAENWRGALKTIVELKKENDRVYKKLDQLRKLDVRHEERRGQ